MWWQAIRKRAVNFIRNLFKMSKIVRLFIGEREVDFKTTPDIFYNFTEEDLTNPTVVNNSFSKTITIEGTPNNNKIFGEFWHLDRYQVYGGITGVNFNPSKKTPFKLYVNGELYESGYVKLDAVRKNGNLIEYDVTLFGGLGEFFFDLSYNDDGDKLTLADLTYRLGGDADEFNFTINKETIKDAWIDKTPYCSDSYLWHYINFAPCYNGYPENLSADKCLVNFSGLTNTLSSSVESGGTTYSARNGWALGTLPDKLDEWGMRDLRSWAQRPVLRVKGMFEGIQRYAESKGYELDLDETFFRGSNPYYWDSWITLPLLSETNIAGTSSESGIETVPRINYKLTYNGWTNTRYRVVFEPSLPVGCSHIDMNVNLRLTVSSYSKQYMSGLTGNTLYTSANINGWDNPRAFGGIALQILCYDGEEILSSNVIGGSVCKILTSKVGNDYLKASEIGSTYWINWGSDYEYAFGDFVPQGDWYYDFSETIPFSFDFPTNTRAFVVSVIWVENIVSNSYQYRLGKLYTGTSLNYFIESGSSINTIGMYHDIAYALSDTTAIGYGSNESAGYSGAKLTKKALLSTEYTPAEYLLSYCKHFGLHFFKYPNDNVIHIMQRGTFYDWSGATVDMSEKIDTAEGLDISPLSFDAKWYNMELETVGGDFENKYENTYGRKYGIQRINTGYEFTAEEKNLFEDNIFRSAVDGVAKDKYYLAPVNVNDESVPYVVFQGLNYQLYAGTGSTTVNLDDRYGSVESKPLAKDKYYDGYFKPQFCDADRKSLDGKNVLVFFNGIRTMKNSEDKLIPYFITDDISDMGTLNSGKPCWIMTSSEFKSGGTRIAYSTSYLPSFTRDIMPELSSNYINWSWDFGQPKELFIPEAVSVSGGTIYGRFWKNYINDLYDVNTRIMRCQVLKDELKPSPELFRKFYWYGNALWRLNKIEDWNIATSDKGTAEFVKINNASAYASKVIDGEPEITLTVDPTSVPQSGGTVTGTINISNGGGWYFDGYPDYVTITPEQGRGNGSVSITIAPSLSASRIVSVTVFGGEYTTATAQIAQGVTGITVNPSTIAAFAAPMTTTLEITDVNNNGWSLTAPEWVTLSQDAGTGSAAITVNIAKNTGAEREGNIVLTNTTTSEVINIPVTQDEPVPATIAPSFISFSWIGGSNHLNVTDVSENGWTLDDTGTNWITLSATAGTGNAVIDIVAQQNDTEYQKSSILVFQDNTQSGSTNIPIYQNAYVDTPVSVSPTSISAGSAGQQTFLSITDESSHSWTVSAPSWITLGSASGTGNGQVLATIARNYDESGRTGNIIVTDVRTSGTTAVTVTQQAAEPVPPSYNCHLNLTYGDVHAPEAGNWDYMLYYSFSGEHPVGEGFAMANIGGVLLYPGSPWNPSQESNWEIYQPFSGDISDTSGIDIPESFKGQTIYLQVELGSGDLGYAVESPTVSVTIPLSGGEVNVTIPQI